MSKESRFGFSIVPKQSSIWYQPTKLIQFHKTPDLCKKCNVKLRDEEIFVPFDEKHSLKVPGRYCYRCQTFYVISGKKIYDALLDNPHAKQYSLNGQYLWNYSAELLRISQEKEKKEKEEKQKKADLKRLAEVPFSVVLIAIRIQSGETREYIIVNKKSEIVDGITVLHYTSEEGKELLSAAFAIERGWTGRLHGKDYSVLRYTKTNSYNDMHDMIPAELQIKAGGGYYITNRNGWEKLVDLLVFSPFLQRYEILHATFTSIGDYCYTDPGRFRDFVHKYGNPGIDLDFSSGKGGGKDWNELNTESILKIYGYSVGAQAGLSVEERRELLAELVDLEILTVQQIVHFLEWTISTHPQWNNHSARQKWAEDIEFIKDYKVNPERFLIARL